MPGLNSHQQLSFQRTPFAIAKKGTQWLRSLVALRPSDILLPSFPKTGSTWVRIVCWNMYALKKTGTIPKLSFDQLDAEMPELGKPATFNQTEHSPSPRLIKTHHRYLPIFYRRHQSLLIARHPLSTLDSLFAYTRNHVSFRFQGTMEDLARDPRMGIEAMMRFYASWLPHTDLVLTYEALRNNPGPEFARLFSFMDIPCTAGELDAVLEASSLARTRDAQNNSSAAYQNQYETGFMFARSGRTKPETETRPSSITEHYNALIKKYAFTLYPVEDTANETQDNT